MSRIGKFVQYRTIAQVADHVDCAGYRDITDWPTMDDAIIGAHEIAANSTRFHQYSNGLLVKWAIAQAATIGELGQLHWRTIETIALSSNGARIVHIVSDKSGISFDLDTDDFYLEPQQVNLFSAMDRANLKSVNWIHAHLLSWGFDVAKFQSNFPEARADMRDQLVEFWMNPQHYLSAQDGGSSEEIDPNLVYIWTDEHTITGFAQDSAAPGAQDEPLTYIVDTDEPPSYEPYVAQDEPSSPIEFHFDNTAPLSGFAQDSITEDSTAPGAQDDDIYIPSINGHDWMGNLAAQLRDDVAIETDLNTNCPLVDDGETFKYSPSMAAHLEQRATGISNDIRMALVSQLGYTEGDASTAMISWRLLDNGGYGWIAEFPNGAAHHWDIDAYQFVKPMPRVVLSPAQVDELLIQMAMFSDIVDEGMRLGDIQRCCNASEYVIAINRLLN